MEIAILVFEGLTALDAVGPYEVLHRLPGAEVAFVATEPGPCRDGGGALTLVAENALDDVAAPDVLLVPGGPGVRALVEDERVLGWVREMHRRTTWTASVCTGALVLAAAGLLDGREAATHWNARDELARLGAVPSDARIVEHDGLVTAAGVSAGIDMALHLAARLASPEIAQAVQLSIEYDPEPPFDTGSVAKAGPELVEVVRAASRARSHDH